VHEFGPVAVAVFLRFQTAIGVEEVLDDRPAERVEQIADALHRLWTDDELCTDLARKGIKRTKEWTQPQFTERLHQIVIDASKAV